MKKYLTFLIPVFIAFFMASFYVVKIPNSITSDALEYDKLSNSILAGTYSIDGKPNMEREPGYPFFRADLKKISASPEFIRWIQVLMYVLSVLFIGIASKKIEPKLGLWGVWGASLSYGLAFYPSVHLTETLVAFLLSLIGLFLSMSYEKIDFKNWLTISILSGFLLLTKYTYILIPLASFLVLYILSKKQGAVNKKILMNLVFSLLIVFSIVFPWVLRNYRVFHEFNVAGRSGAILYARSVQANNPWKSIPDSLLSTILGRGILFTIYPNNQSVWLEQWGDWWRNPDTIKAMWSEDPTTRDKERKKMAFEFIFGSKENFAKYISWSFVNEIRLLQLPNPIIEAYGSPFEGTYGPLAKEGKLSTIQMVGLILVHIIQLLWFICILLSTYFGFKKYGLKFIPGIFLLCILAPHFIADNIARYSAPLQPWLLSGIFMTILFPLHKKAQEKIKYKTT